MCIPGKVRRFKHKEGFRDDTDYIELFEDGTYVFVLNNGNKVLGESKFADEWFVTNVDKGIWEELDPIRIYKNTGENLFDDV
jgi:hypothetical protein